MDTFEVNVTSTYGTYMARGAGKTASCTAGQVQAVQALSVKVFGKDVPVKIKLIETISMGKTKWEVAKGVA